MQEDGIHNNRCRGYLRSLLENKKIKLIREVFVHLQGRTSAQIHVEDQKKCYPDHSFAFFFFSKLPLTPKVHYSFNFQMTYSQLNLFKQFAVLADRY